LEQLPEWEVVFDHHLQRDFTFKDFVTALDFVNRAAAIAEEQGHHPEITLGWGHALVRLWTHKIDGLTESDFVLAAKFDALACSPFSAHLKFYALLFLFLFVDDPLNPPCLQRERP